MIAMNQRRAAAALPGRAKYGTLDGVFVRVLLGVLGVIAFVRLGWVVGVAGVGHSLLIVVLSMTVVTLTTLSLSAICSNGVVEGGGAYYLISRSLGPEFGVPSCLRVAEVHRPYGMRPV